MQQIGENIITKIKASIQDGIDQLDKYMPTEYQYERIQ
jgi:hypothetical protein